MAPGVLLQSHKISYDLKSIQIRRQILGQERGSDLGLHWVKGWHSAMGLHLRWLRGWRMHWVRHLLMGLGKRLMKHWLRNWVTGWGSEMVMVMQMGWGHDFAFQPTHLDG